MMDLVGTSSAPKGSLAGTRDRCSALSSLCSASWHHHQLAMVVHRRRRWRGTWRFMTWATACPSGQAPLTAPSP